MKKIFTLLFFAGFLTSAFAQSNHREHYGNQTNDNRSKSSKYGDNNYDYPQSNHDNEGYHKNGQWNKRDNDYGYNKDRDCDRDDMRRSSHNQPQYGKRQREVVYSPYQPKPKVPLIKVLFGISGLF